MTVTDEKHYPQDHLQMPLFPAAQQDSAVEDMNSFMTASAAPIRTQMQLPPDHLEEIAETHFILGHGPDDQRDHEINAKH